MEALALKSKIFRWIRDQDSTARCKETPTNTSIEGDQATPPACAVFNAFTVEHSSVL